MRIYCSSIQIQQVHNARMNDRALHMGVSMRGRFFGIILDVSRMPEGFYKALFGPICDVPREESILNRSREFLEEIGKRARDGCQRT